jgi:hypothetical protein
LPVAAGLTIAALFSAATPDAPAATPLPGPLAPARLAGTDPADCVPCHAREVSEWRRSAMAFAVKSPLFGALESVVEEQVARDDQCPSGADVLRKAGAGACVDSSSSIARTGSGGEQWCVSCHAPGENLHTSMPAWSALSADARTRAPLRDLLPASTMNGISCATCHQTIGPVDAHARARARDYEGNATWTSFATGQQFFARPEDALGLTGIANSGYRLDAGALLGGAFDGALVHPRTPDATARYLRTSEFCGACHDVRLFGTDVLGATERGEHFKRLRNAYSEWRAWADGESRAGRTAATCQDCHMSEYPGVCAPGGNGDADCPSGTHFESRAPGSYASARVAPSSAQATRASLHTFTSVDIPLADGLSDALVDDPALDVDGVPLGLRARCDAMLRHTFAFAIEGARRVGGTIEIPVHIENVGAGHRVPAGFSQEREVWVEMRVTDARGQVLYEVGKLARPDADLDDKVFARVTTSDAVVDARGRPLGVFGADVVDGPDVPQWVPEGLSVAPGPIVRGATRLRGRGLVNLQNGFLRCVRCIGFIDASGRCRALPGQEATRAARFADGAYDIDTGECRSNLSGDLALFETYFPVGALDADRGVAKAPDAIIDTRSAPPGVPLVYTYVLDVAGHPAPFAVDARLRFRAFPPYLVRAFATYEAEKAREGLRPSGPQVTLRMLRRIEPIDMAHATARVP